MADNPFRNVPAVHDVLAAGPVTVLLGEHSHAAIVNTIRIELADLRQALRNGESPNGELDAVSIAGRVAARLRRAHRPKLVPVINATGIVLHTNLGRAPLAEEAALAACTAA